MAENLGAGGVPPPPPNAEAIPEEEVAHEDEQRPSLAIPGERQGSTLYADGNGHYFYSERVRGNRRFLKCSERRRRNCLARASMGLEEGAPISPTFNSPFHNHQSNASKGETLMLMARLKERAKQETESRISEIMNEEAVRHPEASYSISPVGARRAMKRARGTTEPAIPRTLQDMREEILRPGRDGLSRTRDGSQYFFLDEAIRGDDGETLAEGFVSRRIVNHLSRHPAESSHLLMDATFKIVPRRPEGIQQFFSIHILYLDVVFPVAFFLMRRKTEDCYRRILLYIRENYVTWQVTTITTDFEIALINAVRAIFQGVRHQGCWFHFCQAIWRHVMAEGLTTLVREEYEVKKVVKMIMALPHLPPQRGPPHNNRVPTYSIVDGLDAVNNYIDEGHLDVRLQRLISYVRRFWLGVIGVESISTFDAARRTNNDLESFHAKLLSAFGVNLDIWTFIRRLQAIEQEEYTNLRRVDRDNPQNIRRTRRPQRDNTETIRAALQRLTRQEITVVNFLSQVGHCANNVLEMNMAVAQPQGLDEEAIDWLVPVAAEEVVVADFVAAQQRPAARRRRRPVAAERRPVAAEGRPVAAEGRPVAAEGRPVVAENDQGQLVRNECVICMTNESTHIAIPCGHVCMCTTCAEENEATVRRTENEEEDLVLVLRCPLCNTPSTQYLRAWFNAQ